MKKILVSLTLAATLITSAFASDNIGVSKKIQDAFKKEFKGAEAANWQEVSRNGVYQVSFVFNQQRLNAYYDTEGTLLATGRYVEQKSLPLLVTRRLTEKYNQYEVAEVIEFTTENETSYIVKLNGEKQNLYIQAYTSGGSIVLKKDKKS